MTIEERFNLLAEAEHFYSDLSDAWEDIYRLWLRKSAALWTAKEWLENYKTKMLGDEDWTEEELEKWLTIVLDWNIINKVIKDYNMTDDEADFYLGWFGLAKSIMEGDEEIIKDFRLEQSIYDDLIERKFGYDVLLSNQ